MIKKYLIALCLLVITTMSAQKPTLGLKAGLNFASWSGDINDSKFKTGFHAGLTAEIKVGQRVYLVPELLYSQHGARFHDEGSIAGVRYGQQVKAKFNYLTLPVLLSAELANRFRIQAGPQISYLLSAKADTDSYFDGYFGGLAGNSSSDIKNLANSFDFGAVFGLSYDISKPVYLQARHLASFTNVNSEGDNTIRNSVLQFSIGYKFK